MTTHFHRAVFYRAAERCLKAPSTPRKQLQTAINQQVIILSLSPQEFNRFITAHFLSYHSITPYSLHQHIFSTKQDLQKWLLFKCYLFNLFFIFCITYSGYNEYFIQK